MVLSIYSRVPRGLLLKSKCRRPDAILGSALEKTPQLTSSEIKGWRDCRRRCVAMSAVILQVSKSYHNCSVLRECGRAEERAHGVLTRASGDGVHRFYPSQRRDYPRRSKAMVEEKYYHEGSDWNGVNRPKD